MPGSMGNCQATNNGVLVMTLKDDCALLNIPYIVLINHLTMIVFNLLIILVVILGLWVQGKDLYAHFRKTRKLPKSQVQWKATLSLLGLYILCIQAGKVLTAVNGWAGTE